MEEVIIYAVTCMIKAISQYEHISQNISQLTQEPETITSFSIWDLWTSISKINRRRRLCDLFRFLITG